jgi:urea carboxylase
MLEVIKPGLETSVQDYPGRIGYWNQGFPPSGPMDSWSFRLANVLVGNEPGAAGLECQFVGPTLKFQRDGVVAVTGADMQPKLDDEPIPTWQSLAVKSGQTLALSFAKTGARAYIAIAGGIDTPPWLGSRSTFHKAGVGGMDGHAIKAGQVIPVAQAQGRPGRRVKPAARPPISTDKRWTIEAVADRTTIGSTKPGTSAS